MEDQTIVEFKSLAYRVFLRFLRGFMAGAISSMVLVVSYSGSDWGEVKSWLSLLVIAGVSGGISGGLLAIDKAIRK
jgi:hypothetical protein